MKIAAVQMVSTMRVEDNLAAAERLIAQAAQEGADLVALPEYFCLMGRNDSDKLAIAETPGDGPIQRRLASCAREHALWVVGGTLPIATDDPRRVLNASCVFAPDGSQAGRYDKIHLFKYDNGGERYDEGRVIRCGTAPTAVEIETPAGAMRVGLSVCYDLRFPELYRAMMNPPCDLICVPSAFTVPTGRAHWEVLLRARAIENQCYVMAPAQGGQHESGRRTWGHTLIVDPWGDVLVCRDEGEGVVYAQLDLTRLQAVRSQLPALEHRCDFSSQPARSRLRNALA
jgi:predicted amidohydrolase